jgi:ribosome-binding factor A
MTHPRRGRSPSDQPRQPDRKTLQMCSQVQRTLDQILSGELGDDRLRDLYVSQVVPAPDAHCLMVSVSPLGFAKDFQPQVVLARLAEHTGRLRAELARAINRKKTPELLFRVVLTEDLPPPQASHDFDDDDGDEDFDSGVEE